MKKLLILLSTLLIAVTETSFGNQPDMEKIPQNANWVAHVNFETFRSSEVGSFVLKEILKLPQMKQKLDGLKIGFGVDIDQLGFVTAYGSGAKNEGVIFAKGGFNTKQLEGFASLNEKVEIKSIQDLSLIEDLVKFEFQPDLDFVKNINMGKPSVDLNLILTPIADFGSLFTDIRIIPPFNPYFNLIQNLPNRLIQSEFGDFTESATEEIKNFRDSIPFLEEIYQTNRES